MSPPSRPPLKGCAWEKLAKPELGFESWAQRCDFGFRKIDFLFVGASLAVRFSDGGKPDPLVDVIDLLPGETPESGVKRVFAERTGQPLAGRCVMVPFREKWPSPRRDVKRLTFVPDAVFQKEVDAKADPNEVGDPPCGDWGASPDGVAYFEIQPKSGVRKILFVRVGQDEPLFDEGTLRLVTPRR